MKSKKHDPKQHNTTPVIAKDPNSRDPRTVSASQQKQGRKRSPKQATLSVGIAVDVMDGENILHIDDGTDIWVLESDLTRIAGPGSAEHRKKYIPNYCFAMITIPKIGGGKVKLEALSVTRQYAGLPLRLKSRMIDREKKRF